MSAPIELLHLLINNGFLLLLIIVRDRRANVALLTIGVFLYLVTAAVA